MPKTVKYLECPACRQPMIDLSNDPRFVNHNPRKAEKTVNLRKKEVSKDTRECRYCGGPVGACFC